MREPPMPPGRPAPPEASPGRDIVVVFAVTALSIVAADYLNLNESLYALTRRGERFQVDELPIAMLVLLIGLMWLSWRRYAQATPSSRRGRRSPSSARSTTSLRRMLAVKPETRVLIFSMHEEAIFARRTLQAGAFGYVTKASAPDVLVQGVHSVAAGKKYLSSEIAQTLALRDVVVDSESADGLSAREFEVLRLLARGQSIGQIAQSMRKLGADTAIQLLKRAAQMGLDQPDPNADSRT